MSTTIQRTPGVRIVIRTVKPVQLVTRNGSTLVRVAPKIKV